MIRRPERARESALAAASTGQSDLRVALRHLRWSIDAFSSYRPGHNAADTLRPYLEALERVSQRISDGDL